MTGPRRTILDRRRKPLIDVETIEMFKELEAVPARQRKSDEFKKRDRELARRLNLGYEWLCCVQSVTRRDKFPPSPHLACHESWHRVRAVRLRLLGMAGLNARGRPRRTAAR